MKVAIVGSRGYPELEHVRQLVRKLDASDVVITGGAPGVDQTAEDEARLRGLEVVVLHADWRAHGPSAGPIRNTAIVRACDRLVAFWDGTSRGTLDAITKARARGLLVTIKRPGEAWRALGREGGSDMGRPALREIDRGLAP